MYTQLGRGGHRNLGTMAHESRGVIFWDSGAWRYAGELYGSATIWWGPNLVGYSKRNKNRRGAYLGLFQTWVWDSILLRKILME